VSRVSILLFVDNYLNIRIPSAPNSVLPWRDGDLFSIQCLCFSWPVTDLYQEWGINNYPGLPAVWVGSFMATPKSPIEEWQNPETHETWYWILLHPIEASRQPILALCLPDKDRSFFGVCPSRDSAAPLFEPGGANQSEARVPVRLRQWDADSADVFGSEAALFARLEVYGEVRTGWTIADIQPALPLDKALD
jgi:hypothetical protein